MKRQLLYIAVLTIGSGGCSTMKSVFATDPAEANQKPISNPFGTYYTTAKNDPGQSIILRSKKGDRSVEVELPKSSQDMTDFVIPVSPAFKDTGTRAPASGSGSGDGLVDESYKDQKPGMADREITSSFPQTSSEDEAKRREVEANLGLMPEADSNPEHDRSYLASMDHVKQLYRLGRYEAALLEIDSMILQYQTDPRLYEMRGTLLERVGKIDLALKSWRQSLKFDPANASLQKFVERKEKHRSLASP